jgi:hypothetical protein
MSHVARLLFAHWSVPFRRTKQTSCICRHTSDLVRSIDRSQWTWKIFVKYSKRPHKHFFRRPIRLPTIVVAKPKRSLPFGVFVHTQPVCFLQVFLQFRRSNFSLDLYRYLVEHSISSYVVYQTLTALREGIVKEWSSLDDTVKEQVVQYLLSYVYANHTTLSAHVREQALQILVVINKRRKAQQIQLEKHELTVGLALNNLLQSSNDQEFQFGLMLLNAFINEYSFSNGRSC